MGPGRGFSAARINSPHVFSQERCRGIVSRFRIETRLRLCPPTAFPDSVASGGGSGGIVGAIELDLRFVVVAQADHGQPSPIEGDTPAGSTARERETAEKGGIGEDVGERGIAGFPHDPEPSGMVKGQPMPREMRENLTIECVEPLLQSGDGNPLSVRPDKPHTKLLPDASTFPVECCGRTAAWRKVAPELDISCSAVVIPYPVPPRLCHGDPPARYSIGGRGPEGGSDHGRCCPPEERIVLRNNDPVFPAQRRTPVNRRPTFRRVSREVIQGIAPAPKQIPPEGNGPAGQEHALGGKERSSRLFMVLHQEESVQEQDSQRTISDLTRSATLSDDFTRSPPPRGLRHGEHVPVPAVSWIRKHHRSPG